MDPNEPDVILKLVDSFVTDTIKRLARLHAAAASGDTKAFALEAHTLKGSAAAFGAELMRCSRP